MMLYAKIAAAVIALGIAYWQGYSTMRDKHLLFVAEVKRVGEAQEAANKSAVEIAEVITESVKENYETRIASIKSEYARRVRNTSPGSCPMPAVSKSTPRVNGGPDDPAIVELCALETAKLIELQNWVKKQSEARK
jgi:hypothetical protein